MPTQDSTCISGKHIRLKYITCPLRNKKHYAFRDTNIYKKKEEYLPRKPGAIDTQMMFGILLFISQSYAEKS